MNKLDYTKGSKNWLIKFQAPPPENNKYYIYVTMKHYVEVILE